MEKRNLHFHREAFLAACGFRALAAMIADPSFSDTVAYIQHQKCRLDLRTRDTAKSVELQPSDRPGEVTIVTLKRFECIEVRQKSFAAAGPVHSSCSLFV